MYTSSNIDFAMSTFNVSFTGYWSGTKTGSMLKISNTFAFVGYNVALGSTSASGALNVKSTIPVKGNIVMGIVNCTVSGNTTSYVGHRNFAGGNSLTTDVWITKTGTTSQAINAYAFLLVQLT